MKECAEPGDTAEITIVGPSLCVMWHIQMGFLKIAGHSRGQNGYPVRYSDMTTMP